MPSATTPLATAGKAAEGEPRVRRPVARRHTEPLAEGGFVVKHLLVVLLEVIAVDDQSDYPKSAPRTKLSGFTPNVEAVVAYHPDLVVISYSPKDFAGALAKAHVPVLLQEPA